MNRLLSACCFAIIALLPRPAQAQQDLKVDYDCEKTGAGFARVYALDHREKGQLIGYVQTGAFNKQKSIQFNGSLADSLARFFQPEHASIRGNRELAIILEDLFMSEQTHAMSEDGRLKLSLRLFVKNEDGRFAPLMNVDTIYTIHAFDVTKKMLHLVSDRFCELALTAENMQPQAGVSYTMDELQNLDSVEMLRLPVFANKPQPGIYRTYQSFKMNTPDIPAEIGIDTTRYGNYSLYQAEHTAKGKLKKTYVQRSSTVYAVSDGEHLFKYFDENWCPITKTGSGLCFDSKTAFSHNAAMWGGALGGVAGAVIADAIAQKHEPLYRYKINPRTGIPVPAMIVKE